MTPKESCARFTTFISNLYLFRHHKRAMGTNRHNFIGLIVILWSPVSKTVKRLILTRRRRLATKFVKHDRSDCKNICNQLRRVFSNGHDPIHLHKIDKARAEKKSCSAYYSSFGKLARTFHGKGIKLKTFPKGYVISLCGVVVQYRRVEPKVPGSSPT